jgi:trk system potassium uptake protein
LIIIASCAFCGFGRSCALGGVLRTHQNSVKEAYRRHLTKRYRLILGYTGLIWAVAGLIVLTPALFLLTHPAKLVWPFPVAGALLILPGLLAWKRLPARSMISMAEGAVIVFLAWGGAIIIGSLPFLILSDLGLTQAIFEATSGWTTTGLTMIEVAAAPAPILFYRSILQLAGGAGLAILLVSLIASPAAPGLSIAEGRRGQLVPHVVRSAKLVVRIYAVYVLFGIFGLRIAGMEWFDAVVHTFSAVSTGGFSTKAESIGFWDDPGIEAVIMVLEILGMTSFLTAYSLTRRRFGALYHNAELRLSLLLVPIATAVLFIFTVGHLYIPLEKAVRISIFETISALSTTGFSLTTYGGWNDFGLILIVALMLIGGGAGSTAGGIKQIRVIILYRMMSWEISRSLMPARIDRPNVFLDAEAHRIENGEMVNLAAFLFLYLTALLLGVFIMAAHGLPLSESLFEMTSTLSTVGLSAGVTRPDLPGAILWTQIIGMFMGRLEFLAIFIAIKRMAADLSGRLRP